MTAKEPRKNAAEPRSQVSLQTRIKNAIVAVKNTGVLSFVIGSSDGAIVTTHVENMSPKVMSQVAIALFTQTIESEISLASTSETYRNALRDLLSNFHAALKMHNARVASIAPMRKE